MPAVSEEELDQLRKDNEKLREQISNVESKVAVNAADRQREYEALQLQQENARLQGRLDAVKATSTVTASREGASSVLEAAQAQLEAAKVVASATVGPVDVNDPENKKANDTGSVAAVEGDPKVNTGTAPLPTSPAATATSSNGGNS